MMVLSPCLGFYKVMQMCREQKEARNNSPKKVEECDPDFEPIENNSDQI